MRYLLFPRLSCLALIENKKKGYSKTSCTPGHSFAYLRFNRNLPPSRNFVSLHLVFGDPINLYRPLLRDANGGSVRELFFPWSSSPQPFLVGGKSSKTPPHERIEPIFGCLGRKNRSGSFSLLLPFSERDIQGKSPFIHMRGFS